MMNKFKTLSFVLLAVLLAACSGSDRSGDVRSELLGFVPAKTSVVISVNPQKLLQSAGGDWSEKDGIVFGPYIEDCIKAFGQDPKEIDDKIGDYLKIEGLNPESFIIATNRNFRSWYLLGAISDKDKLKAYLDDNYSKLEFETIEDFEVAGDGNSFLLLDNADRLVWVLNDRDAEEAVKTVKKMKSRASDNAMPKWTHKYVGSGDNFFAALGDFGAMGVNLSGLMKMVNVPDDLLGGDIAYMAFTAKDKDHKASGELVTLDEEGENVPLLNEKIYKSADLSALNLLPEGCNSKVAMGISGEEVFDYIPMLRQEIGDANISSLIASLKSIAFGVGSINYSALEGSMYGAMYGAPTMTEFPMKNVALVVKFAPGKSAELMNYIASMLPGLDAVDENTLKMSIAEAGIKGMDAVYFSNQKDALIISLENLKAGNNSESLPSDALAYSYTDSKVYAGGGKYAFASEMFRSGNASWDAKGLHSEMEFSDDCPGALAFVCKFISVYASDMMKAQARASEEVYNDADTLAYDDIVIEEVEAVDDFVE